MKTEDMDNIIATSEWKGYWESLINENTVLRARVVRLEEALKEILGWRELRDTTEFPIERVEGIARRALEEK